MMPARMTRAAAMFALVLLMPSSASAGEGTSAISEAKRLLRVPKYQDAIHELDRALLDPSLSSNDRIEALVLLGSAHIARNDAARAEEAFRALLDLAPDHDLAPSVSPKIRAVFDRVKQSRAKPPRIETVTASLAGDRVVFVAKIADPDLRAGDVLLRSRSGTSDFLERPMIARGGVYTASIAVEPGSARLEYFVTVVDGSGQSVELGSSILLNPTIPPPEPKAIQPVVAIDPPPEPSIVSRWWFWTIIAVAVAGAAVGTYFIAARSGEPENMGNLGPPIEL
jgi:hypothetical protein